jgi:hypothetical protein
MDQRLAGPHGLDDEEESETLKQLQMTSERGRHGI